MISFPSKLTKGIEIFLQKRLMTLKNKEKSLRDNDPFNDQQRAGNNSIEEDVDEQIGRFESEVKINFVKRQIVQVRKALTRLKVGKYGICERCHVMIDTDRLAVKPEATICVKCANERE